MTLKDKKILVTGGHGFLGTHLIEELKKEGVSANNITIPKRPKDDLRNPKVCKRLVKDKDIIIHLAAHVGGIGLNREKPGELFYDNLIMGVHLMEEARKAGVKKFVSIGTVCSYPKHTPVPFKESDLWNGYPEETNAPYGLAKKALLTQGQAYSDQYGFNAIYLMPVNLYGPGDKFDPKVSHVIPALIKKTLEAKKANKPYIDVWGTGKATREFLYVKDAARAIILATQKYNDPEPVNIGSHMEISIKDLVSIIFNIIGYKGKLNWDKTKPNGQPRRKLNTQKALKKFGFKSTTKFKNGLKETIDWYLKNNDNFS